MKTLATTLTLSAALLVAGLLVPAAGPALAGETPQWALAFENDTPRPLVVPGTKLDELTYFWYMVYRVKNTAKEPLPTAIRATLTLTLQKQSSTYSDVQVGIAERQIEAKIERPLLNWAEMQRRPLEPGHTREGVAIFRVGNRAPDFAQMTLSIRGLAARTPLGREGNVQRFRERVLHIVYDYVTSRWAETKELKYNDERWDVKVFEVTDRTETTRKEAESLKKELDSALEKIRKARSQFPKGKPKAKPAPGASAPRARNGIIGSAKGVGRPDPKLVNELAALADQARTIRASFTETIGHGPRERKTTGTLYLHNDKRFAIERTLRVGADHQLKELRVFDGKALWIHTTAKGLGDSVRLWKVADTKAQWRTVRDRPEVDFATVVNPARAWRLFRRDLIRQGVEQLKAQAAYVFDVRPDEKYQLLLTGPLSGELLGQAVGRRMRFWVGADTGVQLRLRIYDEKTGDVVASLECSAVERDAHLPPARFAFAPPPGVEVVDMNAVMARADQP